MTERGQKLVEIVNALMSQAAAGGVDEVVEPKLDLAAVVEAMAPSWLAMTGCSYAERCQQSGLAQARLFDLHWGLIVGYQIARREALSAGLEAMFNAETEGGSEA